MKTPEVADLTVTKTIEAPAERVYDAWLDPAVARKFLFATEGGRIVRAEIDPKVGGRFTMTDRRNVEDFEHVGEFVVLDRPKRIVFDFWLPKFSEQRTRIEVDIVGRGSATEISLTHRDVPPDQREKARNGWKTILDSLAAALR